MNKFEETMNLHKKNLELYVPVVARVHGPSHPVFYDVQKQYDLIIDKIEKKEALVENFETLRTLTNNYEIPSDTCETYEAVYNMLSELDEAYKQ